MTHSDFVDPDKFFDCVHCGLCLSFCPTYVELGTEMDSPRGRIATMRSLYEERFGLDAEVRRHLDLCLGCRACETACPSGVEYGRLIEEARPWVERARPPAARWARRALAAALGSRRVTRFAFGPLRLLGGGRWTAALARRAPGPLRTWLAYVAALPPAARRRALPAVLEP